MFRFSPEESQIYKASDLVVITELSAMQALTICRRKSATMGSKAPSSAAAKGPKSSERSLSLINASAGKPLARAT